MNINNRYHLLDPFVSNLVLSKNPPLLTAQGGWCQYHHFQVKKLRPTEITLYYITFKVENKVHF